MLPKNYKYVNTIAKLEEADAYLMRNDFPRFERLALDTETNGLHFHKDVVIGFSISPNSNEGLYVPLLEWKPNPASKKLRKRGSKKIECYMDGCFVDVWTGDQYPEGVTSKEYQPPEIVKMFLKRWTENTQLDMWNAPFDCCIILYNFNINLTPNLHCDGILLKHVIDENTRCGLKDTANLWKKDLGYAEAEIANEEQEDLRLSTFKNGVKWDKSKKHVWRGDPLVVAKYAIKDTCLTCGLIDVGLSKLPESQHKWFFEDEVMPLCREVVIKMRSGGVYVDVPYFQKLEIEINQALKDYENQILDMIDPYLDDFCLVKSLDETVSQRQIVEKIIELEGLEYPTQTVKGKIKKSLDKKAIAQACEEDPHWLWTYLRGDGEIGYSDNKLLQIKKDLYYQQLDRKHVFNIGSRQHWIWLLFTKLGNDPMLLPQTKGAKPGVPSPSIDADILEEHFGDQYDFIKLLLIYRKLDKLRSTYIEPAVYLNHNGWLHVDMKQHGTISGRFACSGGFNLQTLPRTEELDVCEKCDSKNVKIDKPLRFLATIECQDCGYILTNKVCASVIKEGFIAPPGYKIVNADYSSLEPRCFSFCSGDQKLKDVYQKNLDLYSKVYCDMEDIENKYSPNPKDSNYLKKKNPKARIQIKPAILACVYGSKAAQIAHLMGYKRTIITREGEQKEIPDKERGHAWIDKYLGTYPNLQKYMEQCEMEAVIDVQVSTIVGRIRHFKYTKIIHALLGTLKVDREVFLDAPYKDLEIVNNSLGLNSWGLKTFCKALGYNIKEVEKKKNWVFVRALFKNELNNAKNFKIQGLAAHITNMGMLETERLFRDNGINGYICIQVHDEVCSYVREDQAELGAALLKQGMEQNRYAKLLDIPMEADPIICNNLKDSK